MSITTKKRMQKVASVATSAATILWLSGISMLMPAMAATYADGTLLKASDSGAIYAVNNNLKVSVRSAEVFTNSGYNWSAVKTVSSSALAAVPDAQLIKTATNPDVYKLEKSFIRKLASIEIFNSYALDWGKISVVSQPVMNSFSYAPIFQHGADLFWRDANNVLHKFLTMDSFTGNGYNVRDLVPVNDMEYGSFAFGIDINPNNIPNPPAPGTGLSVSMASDNPLAASVTKKASGVTYLKFNLTAGTDGAVAVSNITVKRVGVGDPTDFASVYLYDGATRLTSGRSVNSTTNEANFASLGLTIPAGSTKTLSVVVDMKTSGATAGNVDAFQLASSAAITTTALINGVFPLTGNSMTVGGSNGGTMLVEKGSNPSNPNVGAAQATVTEFKLTASTEDVNVKRVAVYQAGTISRSNLANFKLYQGTTLLASTASLDSKDLVTFDLSASPFTLAKSIARTFTIKADISGSTKPNDTIKFYVDQTSDIYAVGATYGFGVQVDIGATSGTYDGNSTNYTTITVQGGDITVSTSGPAQGNVAKGANDAPFLNFAVNSVSNAQIKTMRVEMHRTSTDIDTSDSDVTNNYITDVKVIDTATNAVVTSAVDVSSFTNIAADSGVYYTFTDVIDLTAGQTRNFKITADLNASISTGSFYATLGKAAATSYCFSSTSIKSLDNNQYITNIVPSTAISGQYQTTSAASLAVTVSTTPSSQSYIKGAANVESVGFIFTAGTGADVKVSSVKLSGYLSDYSAGILTKDETGSITIMDLVSSISLWDGATQVGTTKSFNTSGEATFDNFTLVIPKGTSKTLVVKANTSNAASIDGGTANLARYAFDIADTSADIAATNNDTQATIDATTDLPNDATGTPKTVITVRDSGSLVASADAGTPTSALVIAGATGVTFAKVKFSSTYEEFKITKLQVAVPTPGTYADNFTQVTIEGGGQAATSVAMGSGGTANFTGLSIIVPKDGSAVVTIKADLATITGGADSGDAAQMEITSTNFEAAGTGSSNTLLAGGDVTGLAAVGSSAGGNDMYVKATAPKFENVALTGNLNAGTMTIFAFKVTNLSPVGGYDVSLKKVLFNIAINDSVVNSSALEFGNFSLYRSGETSEVSNVGFYNGTATSAANTFGTSITGDTSSGKANSTTTTFIMAFTNGWQAASSTGEEVIAAGESKTFYIKADADDVGTGSNSADSVAVGIAASNISNQTARGIQFGTARAIDLTSGTANMIWSDNAAGVNHTSIADGSTTYADWTDAYLVQTLPSDMASLHQ